MKKTILFLLVITTITANAQSLKDALYGGKLKTDTGSVLRKGEDLSAKIDTSTKKKPVVPEKNMSAALSMDSIKKWTSQPDSAKAAVAPPVGTTAVNKDNNKLWKEFVDSLISTLKQEVLTSKKINKGDYFVTVDYAIAPDGQVAITNVLLVPDNKFLQEQVKERLSIDTPKLNPVLAGNGQARKVTKRYNFTLTKD
jgi:hypothetical protein